MKDGPFIVDHGLERTVTSPEGDPVCDIPRYSVWGIAGRDKPEILDASDNGSKLRQKWGVGPERVFMLTRTVDSPRWEIARRLGR